MKKPGHPISNLGKFAHPKKATPHTLTSPKQENYTGPLRAQTGSAKPKMPSHHGKGKRY